MGRPNGAARARCRETNAQEVEILSALEMKARCRDGNRTGPSGPSPTAGSGFRARSLDPVTAARPSFLQAARLSALVRDCRHQSFHNRAIRKKKESSFTILQIETPDENKKSKNR